MSSAMHFRKRQILEYQVETNLKFLAEQKNKLFPSDAPPSFESMTPSPNKDVAEPAGVYIPTEYTPEKPTHTIIDALQLTPDSECYGAHPVDLTTPPLMKQEAEAWADIATKLMQSIESSLMEQKQTSSSIDPKPSAILLSKLSILQGKSNPNPNPNKKPLSPKPKPKPKPKSKPKPPTQTIKANKIKNTVVMNHATSPQPLPYVEGKLDIQRLYDIIGIDPSWAKEKTEVVVKSEVKEEPVLPLDMTLKPHSSFQNADSKPQENPTTKKELEHISNRIKLILAKENHFQQRMEEFAENGIHVYEQVDLDYPQKCDDILIRSDNSSRTYKYTPPVVEMPLSPKKPFVHITADTLPEELHDLIAVADKLNPSGQEQTPPKYPYTSEDDDEKFIIGPNGTQILKARWYEIDWKLAAPAVTRKLLMGVFDRNTLATHSLSGRPSPAFMNLNKPEKMPLDANKVADVVSLLTSRINVTQKEVRMAITSKCADECKIVKIRKQGKLKADKENARVEPYNVPVNLSNDQY